MDWGVLQVESRVSCSKGMVSSIGIQEFSEDSVLRKNVLSLGKWKLKNFRSQRPVGDFVIRNPHGSHLIPGSHFTVSVCFARFFPLVPRDYRLDMTNGEVQWNKNKGASTMKRTIQIKELFVTH